MTSDEVDRENLRTTCHVNGGLRQNANTHDLIFDIPAHIAALSEGTTLEPGDIIATGTPAGVGVGMTPPTFLNRGDEVRIENTGLWILTKHVAGKVVDQSVDWAMRSTRYGTGRPIGEVTRCPVSETQFRTCAVAANNFVHSPG